MSERPKTAGLKLPIALATAIGLAVILPVTAGADSNNAPATAASEANGPGYVPVPAPEGRNLTQPAETTGIRSVVGYYAGEEVLFTHNEISDLEIAKHLTSKIGSPTIYVPALAEVPDSALADVYIFANGVAPEDTPLGPLGYQGDIFDSIPGDEGYSPLRRVLRVSWSDGAEARLLRSTEEVDAALEAGEIVVERPGIVVNMPFASWPGGSR